MHRSRGPAGPATRHAAGLALAAILAASAVPVPGAEPGGVPAPAPGLHVAFSDGLLTVAARDAPIAGVLRAVGEAAELEVPPVDTSETFTGDFSALPLAEGLRRLLPAWSYTLLYDDAGNPERLVLLSTGDAGAGAAATAAPTADIPLTEQLSPAQEESWIERRLASADPGARIVAVRRLDRLPPERASAVGLRVLYTEPEPIVRAELAEALGRVDGDGIVPALEEALKDLDLSVRIAAVQALGRLSGDDAVHSLGRTLLYGNDQALRQAALQSLASHPRQTARDYLSQMATRNDDPIADAARQSLSGAAVPAATEDATGASPCLHAGGGRPGICRKE